MNNTNDTPIVIKDLAIEYATSQTTVFRGISLPDMHCGQIIIEPGMVLTSSSITWYDKCVLVVQSGATVIRTDAELRIVSAGDTALVSTPFQLTNVNAKKVPTSIVFFAMSDAINHDQPSVDNRSVDNDD